MKCKKCSNYSKDPEDWADVEVAGYTESKKIKVLRCTCCGTCYLKRRKK